MLQFKSLLVEVCVDPCSQLFSPRTGPGGKTEVGVLGFTLC